MEGATSTLGVISITPLEMANIGSTIAGGGIHHDLIFVQKVVGADGKVVFDETGRLGDRVLDPDGAARRASSTACSVPAAPPAARGSRP